MVRILVSGFGPWGSMDENPTSLILDRLADEAGAGCLTLALPVATETLGGRVAQALDEYRPEVWIGLGLAFGAAVVAVERLAVNLLDFVEPDIAGARPSARPIVADGPAAYAATVPADDLVARLRLAGIPARVSMTAGTFLCNQLFYQVLHGIAARGWSSRAGFLHVPAHPALVARQAGRTAEAPSMELDRMLAAVRLAMVAARDA